MKNAREVSGRKVRLSCLIPATYLKPIHPARLPVLGHRGVTVVCREGDLVPEEFAPVLPMLRATGLSPVSKAEGGLSLRVIGIAPAGSYTNPFAATHKKRPAADRGLLRLKF
jgi:hypothetical protein